MPVMIACGLPKCNQKVATNNKLPESACTDPGWVSFSTSLLFLGGLRGFSGGSLLGDRHFAG